MNIKKKLKDMEVKLSDFAKELEISRPTLNGSGAKIKLIWYNQLKF